MWRNVSLLIAVASVLVFTSGAQAGRDVTGPLDFVVGVPDDGISTANTNGWPPNELPRFAFDDQVLTKFLHFRGEVQPTGLRVTPVIGPTVVTGLTFTSANDSSGRDPIRYELSGSNDSIDGPYTLIAQGPIVDFAGTAAWPRRTKTTTPIQFANTVSYKHYQIMFPAVRTPGSVDSMQIAEIELLTPVLEATAPVPANGGVLADTWANLTWTPGETAASHDVYFGDNFADVNDGTAAAFRGNQTLAYAIVGLPGFPVPDGLALGTTYYWRIDEVEANGTTKHSGKVWSFTVPPKIAWNPSPRNGAKFVDPNADLSWSAGWGARLHTVYFGDKFDDVNNATGGSRQTTTTYTLAKLEAGKTYYWRVDEFDVATTRKGDVWSFTTAGPGGGLLGEYFGNVNVTGTPALVRIDPAVNFNLTGATSPGAPIPGDGWSARWTADLDIVFDDTYTFSVNSQDGTRLWIDDELVINVWVAWVTTEYASLPVPLKAGIHSLRLEYFDNSGDAVQQLYWTTPTLAKQIIPAGPLQLPLLARRPDPISGTAGVNLMTVPTWKPGYRANSHDVYFGTDAQAVANATNTSPEYKGTKAIGSESLDVGKLAFDTTYFWRVDEVNSTNPASPWKGNVWSFWTGNFLVVEDFESYNDIDPPGAGSNRIFDKWVDGFGTTTNGAVVGNNLPPYAEVGVLHSGAQAMPYAYDNNLKTSEAVMTLVYPKDWTEQGVTKLSLWFQGAATNSADKMYIALNGTAIVYHDNPAATQSKGWNEWVIDLQAFASQGVNLTAVNTVTIGVGTKNTPAAGGTGKLYFDDIRLIKP